MGGLLRYVLITHSVVEVRLGNMLLSMYSCITKTAQHTVLDDVGFCLLPAIIIGLELKVTYRPAITGCSTMNPQSSRNFRGEHITLCYCNSLTAFKPPSAPQQCLTFPATLDTRNFGPADRRLRPIRI